MIGDREVVVDTDLGEFYNVLHPVVMPLVGVRNGGRFVSLSSVSGQIEDSGQVNYSAENDTIIGATRALAIEIASRDIIVNCVTPGVIETQMVKNLPIDEARYVTRQVIAANDGMF